MKASRRLASSGGLLAAAIGLLFTTATSASAHVVYEDDEVWSNTDSSKCVYSRAEVSDSDGNGYARADTSAAADIELLPTDCTTPWYRPSGDIGTILTIWKWSDDQWVKCMDSGWYLNQEEATSLNLYSRASSYGDRPWCNDGWYQTLAFSAVKYAGEWHGNHKHGALASGNHYLPVASTFSTQAAPPKPEWIKEDGTVDLSKAPDRVQVAGPDGGVLKDANGDPITVPFNAPRPDDRGARVAAAKGIDRTVTKRKGGHVVESVEVSLKRPGQ